MKLAPAYNGDILMAHLCVLRKSKSKTVLARKPTVFPSKIVIQLVMKKS